MDAARPELEAIKPGVKIALDDIDSRQFDDCIHTNNESEVLSLLSLQSREDGRVSYITQAMTSEECAALRQVMDSSRHLSFWNDQGRENEKARQFRDADTVEVNLPAMATTLWDRISGVFDKTPIVIHHDDTEHVRVHRHEIYPKHSDTVFYENINTLSHYYYFMASTLLFFYRPIHSGNGSFLASGALVD